MNYIFFSFDYRMLQWRKFKCKKSELRIDITLKCGQSFRWKLLPATSTASASPTSKIPANQSVFAGVLKDKLLLLTQDEENVLYCCVNNQSCDKTESLLKDYFQLKINLSKLYKEWSLKDPIFKEICKSFEGVRILRQDPVENVFSFICSANNNISRISGMVEKMCSTYGELVDTFENEKYYSFPSVESLCSSEVEEKLRELGFGYRAKYIHQSAKFISAHGGESWLLNHRKMSYSDARKSLLQLQGVGPKVADCILLMSCDQPSAVPVDTHMFSIAKQYKPELSRTKTVTDKVYQEVSELFRDMYGEYAGWAHSVLFSADLKYFQKIDVDPVKLENGIKTEEASDSEPKQPSKKKRKK